MSKKAFRVQVDLDLQSVTCPGVWLCANGKVSLQVYMLDCCIQTASQKPNFPISFNEKFSFYKNFHSTHRLTDLQAELTKEWMYMELIQWKNCQSGTVLAFFQTTLDDLLYPSSYGRSVAGVDVDLLMEPTTAFPGTITPKIEISTRTTIDEVVCSCGKKSCSEVVVNPKMISSMKRKPRNPHRKVCHSINYSRRKANLKLEPDNFDKRPPFVYRKADENLISRKLDGDNNENLTRCRPCTCCCDCLERPNLRSNKQISIKEQKPKKRPLRSNFWKPPVRLCNCTREPTENLCCICSKYQKYFNSSMNPSQRSPIPSPKEQLKSKKFESGKCEAPDSCTCETIRKSDKLLCCCCEVKSQSAKYSSENESEKQQNTNITARSSDLDVSNRKNQCQCEDYTKMNLAQKLRKKLYDALNKIPDGSYFPHSANENSRKCDLCNCNW